MTTLRIKLSHFKSCLFLIFIMFVFGSMILSTLDFISLHYHKKISGAYRYNEELRMIEGPGTNMLYSVENFVWNSHYILARQDVSDWTMAGDNFPLGHEYKYYWIIDTHDNKVYGPLSKMQYIDKWRQLEISISLPPENINSNL